MGLYSYRPPRTNEPREMLLWYKNVTSFVNNPTVEAENIVGTISSTQIGEIYIDNFAAGLRPVQIVSALPSLPDSEYPDGAIVILTSDHKIYRSDGSSWTAGVATTDLTGQIGVGQIAAGAIDTAQLAADAVTAGIIEAGAIAATHISASFALSSSGFAQPGDDNTTPGSGWKIDRASGIQAYSTGLAHTFGGAVVFTDGTFMTSIGCALTTTGAGKRYPLVNTTNFTVDGQTHCYKYNASTQEYEEVASIGLSSVGGDLAALVVNGMDSAYGMIVNSTYPNGYGAFIGNSVGTGVFAGGKYGLYAYKYSSGIAPMVIAPDSSASAPSHTAQKGSLWLTSACKLYVNTDGATSWDLVGSQT